MSICLLKQNFVQRMGIRIDSNRSLILDASVEESDAESGRCIWCHRLTTDVQYVTYALRTISCLLSHHQKQATQEELVGSLKWMPNWELMCWKSALAKAKPKWRPYHVQQWSPSQDNVQWCTPKASKYPYLSLVLSSRITWRAAIGLSCAMHAI